MFGRLIGNDNAKVILRRLLATGRVPGALLFSGPDGVGKKQFAFELARAYVCKTPNGTEACGHCPACSRVGDFPVPEPSDKNKDDFRRVFFGSHPDVGLVTAYKRTILVDAIRNLESAAQYSPYEARARFFIIDDADKMNDEASNALLKTLEEPPATTFIVLVTSRPDNLLQTIRSRCQIVRFEPAETAQIDSYLRTVKGLSPDDAALAARVSNGSIGRAAAGNIEEFRSRRNEMLAVLSDAINGRSLDKLLVASEKMSNAAAKEGFEPSIEILSTLIRDVWMTALGSADNALNHDLAKEIGELAGIADVKILSQWMSEIETLRQTLAVNINRKVATDALFVRMSAKAA